MGRREDLHMRETKFLLDTKHLRVHYGSFYGGRPRRLAVTARWGVKEIYLMIGKPLEEGAREESFYHFKRTF
jgi:hypothetical protein